MRVWIVNLFAAFLLLGGSSHAQAPPVPPVPPPPAEDEEEQYGVTSFQVTEDGTTVVYIAPQDTVDRYELYAVPLTGGTSRKLSAPLVSGGSVTSFKLSKDSQYAVYLADQDRDEVSELYSVPIAGGLPRKISGSLAPEGDVQFLFNISDDSSTVVYLADQDLNDVYEIYSVPITGGVPPIRLNAPLVRGGIVLFDFGIDAPSTSVVYLANQNNVAIAELFSVPLKGGATRRLTPLLGMGSGVRPQFSGSRISEDGSTVVYVANQDTPIADELYAVPIGGGAALKLNAPLVQEGRVTSTFNISKDSAYVVYLAEQLQKGMIELFSVPIGGGSAVKLNGALPMGGNVDPDGAGFKIAETSDIVIYVADQSQDDLFELFSVPIGGGSPVKLNGFMQPQGDVSHMAISKDGAWTIYVADQSREGIAELYAVPSTGGFALKINGALLPNSSVQDDALIAPDNLTAVYRAPQSRIGVMEIYAVPVTGGTPIKLNGTIAGPG